MTRMIRKKQQIATRSVSDHPMVRIIEQRLQATDSVILEAPKTD